MYNLDIGLLRSISFPHVKYCALLPQVFLHFVSAFSSYRSPFPLQQKSAITFVAVAFAPCTSLQRQIISVFLLECCRQCPRPYSMTPSQFTFMVIALMCPRSYRCANKRLVLWNQYIEHYHRFRLTKLR